MLHKYDSDKSTLSNQQTRVGLLGFVLSRVPKLEVDGLRSRSFDVTTLAIVCFSESSIARSARHQPAQVDSRMCDWSSSAVITMR